jgi:hypothetical protein
MIEFTVLGLIGLVIWADYMATFRFLGPYEAELAKGSHGAFWIAVSFAFFFYGWPRSLPEDISLPFSACVLFIGGLGAFWLFLGFSRLRWYRFDARHAVRAVVKIIFGPVLFSFVVRHTKDWSYDAKFLRDWVINVTMYWCVITGGTKLFLVCCGVHEPRIPGGGMPHGNAGFSDGEDLE